MVDTIRIRRRAVGGAAGAPASLFASELAYNEQDDTLWYGKGNTGGNATSIVAAGGLGNFLPLTGGTVTGTIRVNQNTSAPSATSAFSANAGANGSVALIPNISSGSFNAINRAGDLALVASGSAINTGVLSLSTWNNTGACGIRITNTTVTISGSMILAADPTTALGAATKQYVDNGLAGSVSSFNTRTGAVTLTSADVTGVSGLLTTGGAMSGGLSFGGTVAPGGATDLSRHIALFSTTFGFSITSNTLNVVANGVAWPFTSTSLVFPAGASLTTSSTGNVTLNAGAVTGTNTSWLINSSDPTNGVRFGNTNQLNQSGPQTLVTTAATASGNVLTFAATTGVANGQYVYGTNIPNNAVITAFDATTITLSANVTSTGVASGASIQIVGWMQTLMTSNSNTNSSQLRVIEWRNAAGTGWTTASKRIQLTTDVSDQGFIEFNPVGYSSGIGFGSGRVGFSNYNLYVSNGAITVTNPAATNRSLYLQTTGGGNRWGITANASAEGGSNAGSDLIVTRFSDTGTSLGNALSILRSSGLTTFNGGVTIATVGQNFTTGTVATATDLSKHIALFSTTYGFSITSGTLNMVVNGNVVFPWTTAGLTMPAGTGILLSGDPVNALGCATKQYVDRTTVVPLATIAALRANTTVSVTPIWVRGYAADADGGEGMFVYVSTDTTSADNGGTIIVDASGRRWYREMAGDPVSVKWFGAKGDGTTNDTTAFRNAIATGLPVHIPDSATPYIILDQITCSAAGQLIYGDGKVSSAIQIGATFNLSATGVFVTSSLLLPGPQFRDFSINFIQPDTTVKGSLTNYPPAFYTNNSARQLFRGLKITAAMTAFMLFGNPGGTTIADCELSAFNDHININGSADTVTVDNCRFEPDTLTANQTTIYLSGSTGGVGIRSARCDDLQVSNCLFYTGQGMILTRDGSGNPTFGTFSNVAFDTTNGINMTDGYIQLASCYFTAASASVNPIVMSGGRITIGDAWFFAAVALTNGFLLLSPAAGFFIVCQIVGGRWDMPADMLGVQAFGVNGPTEVQATGMRINIPNGLVTTKPFFQINTGAYITLTDNRFAPAAGGSGPVVQIVSDGAHVVTGNSFGGRTVTLPATRPTMVYANNVP